MPAMVVNDDACLLDNTALLKPSLASQLLQYGGITHGGAGPKNKTRFPKEAGRVELKLELRTWPDEGRL